MNTISLSYVGAVLRKKEDDDDKKKIKKMKKKKNIENSYRITLQVNERIKH